MLEIPLMKQSARTVLARRRLRLALVVLVLAACLASLLGCAGEETPTPQASPLAVATVPLPSPLPRPTIPLVPTFTPVPTQTQMPSATAGSSALAAEQLSPTPVSFEEVIVTLRYRIPALGLDRRLIANMANKVTVLDAASGQQIEYSNQGGAILEMRQSLAESDLAEIPGDCERCVSLSYELSIEEQEGSGWLQDAVLLASLENYMAVALGPYFPADTTVGLRRSASPYAPAHTIALTEGGELWTWSATDKEIGEPDATITDTLPLRMALDELSIDDLADSYVVDCEGSPAETLVLNIEDQSHTTLIVCPEFSLPSSLLPLYLALDALVEPTVADQRLDRPPAAFPLTALLDYRRADGTRLTLYHDGAIVASDRNAETFTTSLTSAEVISLTAPLVESGVITPGLSTFAIEPAATITPAATIEAPVTTSILVLRGPDGLLEGQWVDTTGVEALAELNALLDGLIGLPEPTPQGTAAPEPTLTPETVENTPTPAATPTP